jgi:succinate dehydrogenase/fumarate reductase flavoprotein subunit
LYCCGELVGGLFYDNYPAGTGLVSGATFGRIAGRNAAGGQVTSKPQQWAPSEARGTQSPAAKVVFAPRGTHEPEETNWVP